MAQSRQGKVGPCRVVGCGRSIHTSGCCKTHYDDMRKGCPTRPLRSNFVRIPHNTSVEARLKMRIDSSQGPDACWPWTAATNALGYGVLQLGRSGGLARAHRLMYQVAHGLDSLPDDKFVRHTRDNPICCSPTHLLLGSPKDNVLDMYARDRRPFGERVKNTRVTETQVQEMRKKRQSGARVVDLSQEYGLSVSQVSSICNYKARQAVPTRLTLDPLEAF